MSAISLSTAQMMLQTWINAEIAVASGQSVEMGGRRLVRANLGEIRESINYWAGQVNQLSSGGAMEISQICPM